MARVKIWRRQSDDNQPLTWFYLSYSVCMRCPKCVSLIDLSKHKCSPEGKVYPVVRCVSIGCEWAGYVTLNGWGSDK